MQIKIHELAAKELDDAIKWYELQQKNLGQRFKKSVIKKINKIKNNPKQFLIEEGDIYKAYIPKFPYKILYTVENDTVIVVGAVAHMNRKPWYWQLRMRE
jgi:mRNA-degrading endonuclease RelE of RelBE toxin-antitoxin system